MSKFYFFTDINLLNFQATGEEFGPVGTSGGNDLYQLTSRHTSSSDAGAYAVCDGVAFVQEVQNSGGNLCNLILQPTQQPPFAFPKIKFFIYRGIKKSSLINGNDIAASNTNDLTKSLWDSQNARNSSAGTTGNPPKEALGIDLIASVTGFANADPLDNALYRTGVNYQLPFVKAGWKIGTFDMNGFGFEIMLESIGFNPAFGLVRNIANNNNINILQVSSLVSSPAQPQFFEHWHDKEEILNYIDPSAFWGSFYHNILRVKSSGGSTGKKNGNEIYDDILKDKFINKNKVYLDIRNEYNFSINYFKNYGVSLTNEQTDVISYDENNSLATKNYYSSGWPMLVFDVTDFATANTTKKIVIKIALPDGNGENELPTIFLSVGTLKGDFPRETKDRNKLMDVGLTNNFTSEISLAVPNRSNSSVTTPISFYIRLKYLKRLTANPPASSDTVIRAQNYLDNLFAPFDMRIPFGGTSNVKSVVYDGEMFVDTNTTLYQDFVTSVGKATDNENIIFYLIPKIIRNKIGKNINSPFSLTGEVTKVSLDFFEGFSKKFKKNIRKSEFELTGGNITYIEILPETGMSGDEFKLPDFDSFFALTIDKSVEWEDIIALANINFLSKYKTYFALINPDADIDDNGYDFTSFDIALRGYELSGGTIQFKEVNTNLKIYTNGAII
ncbi:MAG: hypothetical protein H0X62_01710 [Bacteroidetes bacterium]|nr:hypothetical protein [Bacteroidota bacterium]